MFPLPKTPRIQNRGEDPEALAYVELVRTYELLSWDFAQLFKSRRISQPQYNCLRTIALRGDSRGMRMQAIRERLINRVPDVTRLVDRLEAAGLVGRFPDPEDRRAVVVRLSPKGRKTLLMLDDPVNSLHRTQLGHLTKKDLRDLTRLLVRARERLA